MAFHWNGQEAGRGKRARRRACYNTSHGPAGMLHRVHTGKCGLLTPASGFAVSARGPAMLCRYSCWGQETSRTDHLGTDRTARRPHAGSFRG